MTGTIGDGLFGLAAHRGELADLAPPARQFLTQRYMLPQPRLALGRVLAEQRLAHACADISDGLAADLAHICEASGCGATVAVASVPLSDPVAELVAADPASIISALTGGDDYELVMAVPPGNVAAVSEAARKTGTRVADIGAFTPEPAVQFIDRDGQPLALAKPGFTHF
jgi:thiamine-monophosphate kinase